MNDSTLLLDTLVRGAAIGAMALLVLSLWRSALSRSVQAASLMLAVSTSAWLVTEQSALHHAFGHPLALMLLSHPVGGLFWLFVLCAFEDRRITPLLLAPAILMFIAGVVMETAPRPVAEPVWLVRNLASGALAVHAGVVVVRGWRGDLIEARRRARVVLMGLVSVFVVVTVGVSIAHWLRPAGPWMVLAVGHPLGGAIMSGLILAIAALFIQSRPAVFGPTRRPEPTLDGRAEAADRLTIDRLQAVMAAEGWRREGLTIGDLAQDLDVPEHRLRRLINQRLGHRNFADFLNAYRIEAAKQRLADPALARTTVAAIAFDLGYGSLGPFNRAFRTATGATPSEWRRQVLAQGSPKLDEAV